MSDLKITDVRTRIVDGGRMNWVIVIIETDAGITGVGDATAERRELAVAASVEAMTPYLMGKDPFQVEHHAETLARDSYWRTGVVVRSAISGVEAALIDIKGKALGVPAYELLGGKCRDEIRVYANHWAHGPESPEDVAGFIEAPLRRGFTAVKWDPFGQAWLQLPPREFNAALAQMRAARAEAGPNIDLLIEGHGRFDIPTAIRIGQAITEVDPLFFEEPTPPDNINALRQVRAGVPVPIAAGERYYEKHRFLELIAAEAVDWLQPDTCHAGGLTEMKKLAALSQAAFLPFAPHNPMGPVGNAMAMQLAACVPNFAILETMMVDVPWRSKVVHEDTTLKDGALSISDAPGLGITFDEAAAAEHPYAPKTPGHFVKRVRRHDLVPWYREAQ
ncbi:MAG: mandelate racemase/muconate lactonizing enzyme family protein [Pseudomonadota bacterium]